MSFRWTFTTVDRSTARAGMLCEEEEKKKHTKVFRESSLGHELNRELIVLQWTKLITLQATKWVFRV